MRAQCCVARVAAARFIALTGAALVAVWIGAAALLPLPLAFAPAVLMR